MEKRYFSFSWENYEMVNSVSEEYIIRECIVKEPFGGFKTGDKIKRVYLNYSERLIQVYDENNNTLFTGKLVLSIEPE